MQEDIDASLAAQLAEGTPTEDEVIIRQRLRIERLTAENERLRAALREAADDLERWGDDGTGHTSFGPQNAADRARSVANQQSERKE